MSFSGQTAPGGGNGRVITWHMCSALALVVASLSEPQSTSCPRASISTHQTQSQARRKNTYQKKKVINAPNLPVARTVNTTNASHADPNPPT